MTDQQQLDAAAGSAGETGRDRFPAVPKPPSQRALGFGVAAPAFVTGLGLVAAIVSAVGLWSGAEAALVVGLFLVVALVLAYVIASTLAARAAAEAAERDVRLLIEGAGGTALFKLDSSGRVASWNAGAERLLGYTEEEIVGHEFSVFLPPPAAGGDKALDLPASDDRREVHEQEGWRVRKDGSRLWVHATLTALRDDAGRLDGFVHVLRDISDRKRLEDELSALALQDSLTRLPNRALFLESLARALARAQRYRSILGLLFLDLDDFKAVNDSHGHAAGDETLVLVAERLRTAVRASDFVARLAGDEFTVLCENVRDAGEVATVAQRIVDALGRPFTIRGVELGLGASIGIAVAGKDETPDSLLQRADTAMYRAKAGGGGTVEFWSDPVQINPAQSEAVERLPEPPREAR